ncbi:unnamed protein product [Urochloa humidicola]
MQEQLAGNIDLNEPLVQDAGGVEEVIQAPAAMEGIEKQEDNPQPGDVIDASDQSEGHDEPPVPPQLPDLNQPIAVEVFIPQQEDGPLQIMPEEIQEHELLGNNSPDNEVNSAPLIHEQSSNASPDHMAAGADTQALVNQLLEPNIHQMQGDNNMQLGFVQIVMPEVDPVFNEAMTCIHGKPNGLPADFYRVWSQHFAPVSGSSKTQVPPEWAAFFTAALMNPGSFDWAKKFLESPAWEFFSSPQQGDVSFSFPPTCPSTTPFSCLSGKGNLASASVESLVESLGTDNPHDITHLPNTSETPALEPSTPLSGKSLNHDDISPSNGPWSMALLTQAGKLKVFEDDPSLRRSCRQKDLKKGFRKTQCADSRCIACEADPPTLSTSLIKNLGATFCKISEEKITDEVLLKKKKASAPGGKKPTLKKKPKDGDNDDKTTKKKAKK